MMAITNAIRYKGFFLDCEPIRQGNACFVAQVIITRESGQALDEYAFHELWMARAAADAVSFAKAWGREWIDDHLQAADAGVGSGVHLV
ncbi:MULTISPECIES: hypothetical protein [unclassified Duganella]|uniref:hypothetical protein n=1 Tax=unclassified Duganella TaxID=2636909 RepID=UPI0006F92FA7|nr:MULTISPECIES: hypothetical protein [unclassified Duganella]KQV54793.1 hypothetical protein ASD07_28975 [Duganella sp. Root336D2]